jgi:nucleotide-binding universal stress UspA family protein
VRETSAFHHVGVAYDGSPEARHALAVAYDIAACHSSAVTLFCAVGEAETDLRRARLHAGTALDAAADSAPPGVNPQTVLLRGPAGRVIREACDGVVDLLVTGSRGYGPLQRALAGSVSDALTEGAPHPVLIVPRPATATLAESTPAREAVEAR